MDNGLIKLCHESQDKNHRIQALVANIRILQNEAEAIHNGIAVIWHPEIDAEMVQSATDAKVIGIAAKNVQEAFDAWNDVKARFSESMLDKT
jgi:hypothetical protein